MKQEKIDSIISEIAKKKLLIKTLETRGNDSLDFHEVSVWAIKEALEEAMKKGILLVREELNRTDFFPSN